MIGSIADELPSLGRLPTAALAFRQRRHTKAVNPMHFCPLGPGIRGAREVAVGGEPRDKSALMPSARFCLDSSQLLKGLHCGLRRYAGDEKQNARGSNVSALEPRA